MSWNEKNPDRRSVHRHSAHLADTITLPPDARTVLHARAERDGSGRIEVWYESDAAAYPAEVTLHVHGTGHPLRDHRGRHVSTVIDGSFVWHIYASGETEVPQC